MYDTNDGLAYDPVRDEDVRIDCRSEHRSTRSEHIDGSDLPVLIESDFRHDPVEGCQGSYTVIMQIDDGCPNCGYDRKTVAHHTLAGETTEHCRACGARLNPYSDDPFKLPSEDSQYARVTSRSEKLGMTGRRGISVYSDTASDRLFYLVDHDTKRQFGIARDDLVDALLMMLNSFDEGELSGQQSNLLIRRLIDATEKDDSEQTTDTEADNE
jgi:hypothetical protein